MLVSRPGLQVIDIIGTWQGEQQDVAATARYFRISEDDVRADAQQDHKRALGPR
ncbi:MAG TPA: hypothetical protein VFQ66_05250 [Candidatus Limnocylindria bacterium]|nr:hypothetical protein [Candidatus Limnocylindria bacterium]